MHQAPAPSQVLSYHEAECGAVIQELQSAPEGTKLAVDTLAWAGPEDLLASCSLWHDGQLQARFFKLCTLPMQAHVCRLMCAGMHACMLVHALGTPACRGTCLQQHCLLQTTLSTACCTPDRGSLRSPGWQCWPQCSKRDTTNTSPDAASCCCRMQPLW